MQLHDLQRTTNALMNMYLLMNKLALSHNISLCKSSHKKFFLQFQKVRNRFQLISKNDENPIIKWSRCEKFCRDKNTTFYFDKLKLFSDNLSNKISKSLHLAT